MTQNASPLLVIAGGGTGGHLYPGLAVAQALVAQYPSWRIAFIGTARGLEARVIPDLGLPLHLLPVLPLRGRTFRQTLQGLWALPQAGIAALRLMRRLRPTLALGVGGYAAGPALVAAWAQSVPTWLMEQNAHAGVTNRALGKVAQKILLGMPNPQLQDHAGAQVVGNPVRECMRRLRQKPFVVPAMFDQQHPLEVLILGGSQGAKAINRVVPMALKKLAERGLHVRVNHQAGPRDLAGTRQAYAQLGVDVGGVVGYIDAMDKALDRAHLVICRAGASTLAELAVVGRGAMLIPYPHAADDHQMANARLWEAAGAATVVPQNKLDAGDLADWLVQAASHPQQLALRAARAKSLGRPEATDHIVAAIAALAPAHV